MELMQIANALYEMAKDMDFADYEEHKAETVKHMVEDLERLENENRDLFWVLANIAEFSAENVF